MSFLAVGTIPSRESGALFLWDSLSLPALMRRPRSIVLDERKNYWISGPLFNREGGEKGVCLNDSS